MLTIRLRSRDGIERVTVDAASTLGQLRHKIHEQLNIPLEDCYLSLDQKLLTAKDPTPFKDLKDDRKPIAKLGIENGTMVYLLYHFERQVEPIAKPTVFDTRPFGAHMTVEELVARQTRIERQDSPGCGTASFEQQAANMFQQYVNSALAFSIKRGGLLYGRIDEENNVFVDAIYEPSQSGTADSLMLERGTEEEAKADFIASLLGLKKVGWIFTQSIKERDFIMSTEEIMQIAAMQEELGPQCITAVVAMVPSEDGGDVHFEAFQVSEQCVKLRKDGWFQTEDPHTGVCTLKNPKDPSDKSPVILSGKDVSEVDNDFFLVPVGIADHEGPLKTAFPIENRLLPQGKTELKAHLQKFSKLPYTERLADFHLLLYLAKQPTWDLESDVAAIVSAVAEKKPIAEGYTYMIDFMAGIGA